MNKIVELAIVIVSFIYICTLVFKENDLFKSWFNSEEEQKVEQKKVKKPKKLREMPRVNYLRLDSHGFGDNQNWSFELKGIDYRYSVSGKDFRSLHFVRLEKRVNVKFFPQESKEHYEVEIDIDAGTTLEANITIDKEVNKLALTTRIAELDHKTATRFFEKGKGEAEKVRLRAIQMIESLYDVFDYMESESQRVRNIAKNSLDEKAAELDDFLNKVTLHRIKEASEDELGQYLVSNYAEEREAAKVKLD